MKLNLNEIKTFYLKNGWPIYEVINDNDEFICNIELIPDGWIGIDRRSDIFRWCILLDKLCFINDHNTISYIFEIIDPEQHILKGQNIFTKKAFYLKHIIS